MHRDRLVVSVLVALGLGAAVTWSLRPPPAPEPATRREPPALSLRETSIVLRHNGEKQAEVNAAHVEVSRDLRYAVFTGIANAVLYDHGEISRWLRADQIVLDRWTNDLSIHGAIEITSPQGDRLVAPEAQWINAQQHLIFPQGVQLKIGGSVVQAARLTVDTALQTFDLDGGVDVTFHLGEPPR